MSVPRRAPGTPVLLLLGVVTLLHCGGGGGGGAASAPAPVPSGGAFEGPWTGTLHSTPANQSVTATALVLASGEIRYVASNGIQAVGTVSAAGSAFTGSGTMYAPTGYTFNSNGMGTAPFTISGTGSGGATMTGTYAGAGDTGTLAFTYVAGAAYTSPVALANVAGSYASVTTSSGYATTGTLSAGGVFTGTDAFGAFNGTLTAVDSAKNAFRVAVTYTPAGQAARTYTGLGFFDFSQSPVHLYVQTTGAAGQFAADFQRTGP